MAGPSVVHPVDDQAAEAIHLLSGHWVNSADPIKFTDLRLGLD
jgi:hypothetical protein